MICFIYSKYQKRSAEKWIIRFEIKCVVGAEYNFQKPLLISMAYILIPWLTGVEEAAEIGRGGVKYITRIFHEICMDKNNPMK